MIRSTKQILAALAAVVTVTSTASAQIELAKGKVWVTGHERLRFEYRDSNVTLNNSIADDSDAFLLHRLRVGVGAKPLDWLKVYGELQDAREIGSTRFPANTNAEEDALDWRQGWIELANYKEFPFGLKVGRQELLYGDERLIGAFEWNNVGRVFDAVKLRWQAGKCSVDFFAANVVRNNVSFSRDGHFDDKPYWGDDLFGLYGSSAALDFQTTDLYILLRDKSDATFDGPARKIWTLGARAKSTAKLAPWDYYGELAIQFGDIDAPGVGARRFGDNGTVTGVDHRAFALVIGGGYTFKDAVWRPRLGAEFNYASGDDNPLDGDNETFDNFFPTNHKFFGYLDLFSWKNTLNQRFTVSAKPNDKLTLQADYHLCWLAEERDYWYRASGAPVRRDATGASGRFVGSELDLTFWWNAHKHVKFHGGYSVFFPGEFVKNTLTGSNGRDKAHFLYLQTQANF